jgi:hypothetical protein
MTDELELLVDRGDTLVPMANSVAVVRKLSDYARNLWEILTLCPNKISLNDRTALVSC